MQTEAEPQALTHTLAFCLPRWVVTEATVISLCQSYSFPVADRADDRHCISFSCYICFMNCGCRNVFHVQPHCSWLPCSRSDINQYKHMSPTVHMAGWTRILSFLSYIREAYKTSDLRREPNKWVFCRLNPFFPEGGSRIQLSKRCSVIIL